jgi:hypothetical protein
VVSARLRRGRWSAGGFLKNLPQLNRMSHPGAPRAGAVLDDPSDTLPGTSTGLCGLGDVGAVRLEDGRLISLRRSIAAW